MKTKKLIHYCTIASFCCLSACSGGNYSRVNEKQDTPTDIKISQLNINNQTMDLRFEYRTYYNKTLEKIECEINYNSGTSKLSVSKSPEIKLDAFSTEILSFVDISINNTKALYNLETINYSLSCYIKYDKGTEDVYEKSVLHLVPGSQFSYR